MSHELGRIAGSRRTLLHMAYAKKKKKNNNNKKMSTDLGSIPDTKLHRGRPNIL